MRERKINKKNALKIRVAIMCIATIIIFYAGTNFLKGKDIFGKKVYYYSIFEDINKMQVGSLVYVKGYKIGKVTKLQLIPDETTQICVEVLITEAIDIPKDSKFEIASKDLLGGFILNLHLGNATEFAKSGDTLANFSTPGLTDGLDEMKVKLNNILASVDTIGNSLKDVFAKSNAADNLTKTFENLEKITSDLENILAKNKDKVGNLVVNLEKFSETLNEISPQLKDVIANIDNISDSLAQANIKQTIENANNTINEIHLIATKINKGQGDIGQLVENDSLYRNLEATTANLNALLIDLKENPKRYVHFSLFGKRDKKK